MSDVPGINASMEMGRKLGQRMVKSVMQSHLEKCPNPDTCCWFKAAENLPEVE